MGIMNRVLVSAISMALAFTSTTSLGKESEDHATNVKNLPTRTEAGPGMEVARIAEDLKQLEVFVAKLGPQRQSNPQRHLYEQMIYVIEGTGHTLIWENEKAEPVRLDWEAGDLFSPPLNHRYQHHNDSSTQAAALFNVTTRPLSEVLYGKNDFLNQVDYSFDSIMEEYYPIKEPIPTGTVTTAYVEMKGGLLVKNIKGRELPYNRPGHWGIAFLPIQGNSMAGNRLFELEIFNYQSPSDSPYHRHPWEVIYFVLKGNGGGIFHLPNQPPEYLEFKEGDVYFERSNKYHWHGPINNSEYRIIQIKASAWFKDTMIDDGVNTSREKPSSLDEFFEQVKGRMR
jgi:quercetin dioxygenase-like cupin family protein